MVSDLNNFGIIQNKTKTMEFPQNIETSLKIHYLRGLFDGDGHIGDRQCVFVTGSDKFAEGLKKILETEYDTCPTINKKENTNYFVFNRKEHAFIKNLYENSTIF